MSSTVFHEAFLLLKIILFLAPSSPNKTISDTKMEVPLSGAAIMQKDTKVGEKLMKAEEEEEKVDTRAVNLGSVSTAEAKTVRFIHYTIVFSPVNVATFCSDALSKT